MKNISAFIKKTSIFTYVFSYLIALAVYFMFKKAGLELPQWCFHLFGIAFTATGAAARLMGSKITPESEKSFCTVQRIISRINSFITAVWSAFIFPSAVSFIISPIFIERYSEGYLKFVLILTAVLGVICLTLYLFGLSKVLKQQRELKTMIKVAASPELCNEKDFSTADNFLKKQMEAAKAEYQKILLSDTYLSSNRPDLALDTYLNVDYKIFGNAMSPGQYHCNLLYYYLANDKTAEATELYRQRREELNAAYENGKPGFLHTLAMYHRMTGDIPAARKILNEALQKSIQSKSTLFSVHTENAFICLEENNPAGAKESLEAARSLANSEYENAVISKLEEATSAF